MKCCCIHGIKYAGLSLATVECTKRLFSPTSRSTSVEISQPTSERNSWACTTIHGSLISINSQKPISKVVGCCLSFLPDADQGHYDWQESASDPPHFRYLFSRSIYAIFMSGPHCSKRERRPGPVHRSNLQSICAPTIRGWKKPGKLPATLLETLVLSECDDPFRIDISTTCIRNGTYPSPSAGT